jgi:integrase
MPTKSLTVTACARIRPPRTGQADHFDRGYPGLALRVSYGGAKAWVFFYRLHGKLRRMSLGRFPGMTLDEARDAWRSARLAVDKGESPAHIRPTTADSFAAVAEEWLQRDQAQNRSAREVRRVLEHDVLPAWGDRLIAAITRRDVNELIDAVVDRGAAVMARRLHSHLHRLFRWSVGRGILETNPMADLPKPGSAAKRDRVLTNAELATVWKAADRTAWPFGPAVRLLILTAARRDEIGSLRWSELHGDEIRIPAERSKSGEPRVIPLSAAAVELIGAMPRRGDHVFSTNGSGLGGWSKAKRALDAAAVELNGGPVAGWRLHDIRRTVATGLQRLGVGLQVIESVLGHVGGSRAGIVGVYQRHQFAREKRAALAAWALEVDRIAKGETVALTAVPLTVDSPVMEAAGITSIDAGWPKAVAEAENTGSFDPVLVYLDQPGARLGTAECWWLRQLLERVQFTRKHPGNYVPLGRMSRKDIYEMGTAHVRKLQAEGLSYEEALDVAVQSNPMLNDITLGDFIQRGR